MVKIVNLSADAVTNDTPAPGEPAQLPVDVSATPSSPNPGDATGVPAIEIRSLRKSFGVTQALRGVSLTIAPGEIRALLGENGSGKSTLIKILSGYHHADEGQVFVAGTELHGGNAEAANHAGLRFVHQNLGLVDSLTITENLCLNSGYVMRFGTIQERRTQASVRRELEKVGLTVDPSTKVEDLSPAEKTGVAVARALRDTAGGAAVVLVLDEPTATLPDDEVKRLLNTVRAVAAAGTAIIYVTHRLEEVFDAAHTATVFRDGSEVITRPVAGLTRANILHYMLGSEFEAIESHLVSTAVQSDATPLLSVAELTTHELKGVSFAVRPGEIVGIAGITGSGREELAATIFGATGRESGVVTIEGQTLKKLRPDDAIRFGCAYVPANRERSGAFMELTARENLSLPRVMSFWKWPSLRLRKEKTNAADWFTRLHVNPPGAYEANVSAFSGGNQQKIVFAKWLQCAPRLFLLEEPTQGVDVATKAFLHAQLHDAAAAGAGVVVSSSDVEELASLCHRVLVLCDGRIHSELAGGDLTASRISYDSLDAPKGSLS